MTGRQYSDFSITAYDTPIPFTVTAESGKKETWSVILTGITPVEDISQTQPDIWERMAPSGPYGVFSKRRAGDGKYTGRDFRRPPVVCIRENSTAFPWNVFLNTVSSPI